jgi:hypothetical protein
MADVEYIDDGMPRRLSDAEIKMSARQAGRAAVEEAMPKMLLHIGIDIGDRPSVLEFQADQRFVRRARRSAEDTGRQIKNVGIGAGVIFLFTIIGMGMRAWLKQQGSDIP